MSKMFYDANGHPVPIFRHLASQVVAYTDTAGAVTNGASNGVTLLRVFCTSDAFIAVGAAPTAVADGTDMPITGGVPEYVPVEEGDKISAVQISAGGNLHVTEMI